MKKTITKIIITVASLILFMMVLPWLAIQFADGWAVTGLWMFTFFTVNPALVIGLSIMAGTELRKLWWIPLAMYKIPPAEYRDNCEFYPLQLRFTSNTAFCTFSGTQGGYRKWWNNKVIGENEQSCFLQANVFRYLDRKLFKWQSYGM